jgi:predicted small metal-binding protein
MSNLRWDCLEPGCGWSATGASESELVAAVEEHMQEAHDTFELEEMILAAAVEADALAENG